MFTKDLMKKVHEIARSLEGHYHARLSLAFSIIRKGVKKIAEKVVDISKFLTNAKETEKAYGITVETFGHNGMNGTSKKSVKWVAKSMIKDGCVPTWLFKKIMTE